MRGEPDDWRGKRWRSCQRYQPVSTRCREDYYLSRWTSQGNGWAIASWFAGIWPYVFAKVEGLAGRFQ
jgi:hypothetical protein